MKYSQFNSLIPCGDKHILYNSSSRKVLVLNQSSHPLLDDIQNSIENIQLKHASLYDSLLKHGFWVEKDIDEVARVRNNFNKIADSSEKYFLTINPTMNCNFKCWYCYEEHEKKSKLSEENILNIKKLVQNIIAQNRNLKHFSLSFFGGEPLLYFQQACHPIIQEWVKLTDAHKLNRTLSFTTNGFLIEDKIIGQLQEYSAYTHFQITLDGHRDDHNKVRYMSQAKGSYDKIVNNIAQLVNKDFSVTLRINYTPDNLQNCGKIIQDLQGILPEKKKNLNISFHCVWQESRKMVNRYQDLYIQQEAFKQEGFRVGGHDNLSSVEQMCYADKQNSAVVNFNRDVFKCTARPFHSSSREGFLDRTGSIVWENDKVKNRMDARLKNKPCLSCRILPQCLGGCTQNQLEALDSKSTYCIHNFDDKKIDEIILKHIGQFVPLGKENSLT